MRHFLQNPLSLCKMVGVGAILCGWLIPALALADSHLLVVSGISGEPEFSDTFQRWSQTLIDAAEQRYGVAKTHVVYLSEDPARDPQRASGRSTKEDIGKAFADIAARAKPGDEVFIVLLGHGAARGKSAVFNLPGPDITAAEFAPLLDNLKAQKVVFVNAAAASGPFIQALSGPNRVVISATASGAEVYFAEFGGFFTAAFAAAGADTDKNGQVSVLEAFDYARREVERLYQTDNRLPTEHAMLDDNGDGKGSLEPDPGNGDGALARTVFLRGEAVVSAADSPEVAALKQAQLDLERRIEELKSRKAALETEAYETQLEELLVELALKGRELKAREGRQ
ncbi:MAG: C13 family peptidase [Gammaproteobacteria bacterium]